MLVLASDITHLSPRAHLPSHERDAWRSRRYIPYWRLSSTEICVVWLARLQRNYIRICIYSIIMSSIWNFRREFHPGWLSLGNGNKLAKRGAIVPSGWCWLSFVLLHNQQRYFLALSQFRIHCFLLFISGNTTGLLGYWDDSKESEFLRPDGTFLTTNASLEVIHRDFGQLCT